MTELYVALRELRAQNAARARAMLEEIAPTGDERAWFHLASLLSQGIGGPAEPARAAELYLKAGKKGYAKAQFNLASMLASGRGVAKDFAEALRWYRAAADRGDPEAEFRVGNMHALAEGVARDMPEAIRWWTRSADRGNAGAAENLAMAYARGDGVPHDVAEAVRWLANAERLGSKSASGRVVPLMGELEALVDAGDADAAFALGLAIDARLVEKGQVLKKALALYRAAAKQDHPGACRKLADAYRKGTGVDKNPAKAERWYRRSADLGDERALMHLGDIHAERDPPEADRAIELYRESAEQGWTPAMVRLARLLSAGDEEAKKEAARWLEEAAADGHAAAMVAHGVALRDGIGCSVDLVQAARWFFAALTKGNGDGIHELHFFWNRLSPEELHEADRLADGDGSMAVSTIEARGKGSRTPPDSAPGSGAPSIGFDPGWRPKA